MSEQRGPWCLKAMTPAAVRERLRARPALLVPVGSTEQHGSHLPLGVDTIIVERLADDISTQLDMVRAPTLEYGVHPASRLRPGGAALRRKILLRVMNELIESWEEGAGVQEFLILTAQANEQHQEALSTIRTNGASVIAVDVFAMDFGDLITPEEAKQPGGLLETALMLHLAPDQVTDREADGPKPATSQGAETDDRRRAPTPELGARIYALILERIGRYLTQR
ncbi:MAG: creatininase family protein [Gemmatimonadota bacterium]|nr:creatininase family protein [Gemmatimonadota bacterium]